MQQVPAVGTCCAGQTFLDWQHWGDQVVTAVQGSYIGGVGCSGQASGDMGCAGQQCKDVACSRAGF